MLNIDKTNLRSHPYSYLVQPDVLPQDIFEELRESFPRFGKSAVWNRMSADLMKGDPGYADAISQGVWSRLHAHFHSQHFVDRMLGLFGGPQAIAGVTIDLAGVRLTDHVETREWIARGSVSARLESFDGDRGEVFIRMDLGLGEVGYERKTHCDWRHRICSVLIYFDDAEELEMEGGHFNVEEVIDGTVHVRESITSRKNLGIVKLDDNRSWHSVDKVTRIKGLRRTLYVAISSRGRIWSNAADTQSAAALA